jgi:putative membrane protein
MRSGLVFSSLTAVTLALASPAFAQQAPAGTTPQVTMPQTQMPAQGQTVTPVQKEKLAEKDKNFVTEAAIGGLAEVELGNLAQQNAQHQDVKQFGTRMVQDHSAANQQLMRIVATKDATMPTQLDEQHRKVFEQLSGMRGAEFDRAYMRQMVEDHEKTIKKFREEAQQGNDPDLKAFAQNTMPVLEQHHKLAQDITKSLTAVGSSGQTQGQRNR